MADDERKPLIVIGCGRRAYRKYAMEALASRYALSTVLDVEPDWQREFIRDHRVVRLGDVSAVADAVQALAGDDLAGAGILTWDETVLETTAAAAEKLGMRHMSARSAKRCRDKYLTRSLLENAGIPSARYRLVHSVEEAVAAGRSIGLPVVVKPRALAGSIGVTFVDSEAALRTAYGLADHAAFATLHSDGVLVEEFLDGQEISVDSVVFDGAITCTHVVMKRLGFAPFFEEIGHLSASSAGEAWSDAVRSLVTAAHETLGIEWGVTHAEVRLTSGGPKLIELNGRLGGDFIPMIEAGSTGVDLTMAAADLAHGLRPDLTPTRDIAVEVRFVYPEADGIVRSVDLGAAESVPGIQQVIPIAEPGTTLLLPPRMAVPRIAAIIASAADSGGCAAALDRAETEISWVLDRVAPDGA